MAAAADGRRAGQSPPAWLAGFWESSYPRVGEEGGFEVAASAATRAAFRGAEKGRRSPGGSFPCFGSLPWQRDGQKARGWRSGEGCGQRWAGAGLEGSLQLSSQVYRDAGERREQLRARKRREPRGVGRCAVRSSLARCPPARQAELGVCGSRRVSLECSLEEPLPTPRPPLSLPGPAAKHALSPPHGARALRAPTRLLGNARQKPITAALPGRLASPPLPGSCQSSQRDSSAGGRQPTPHTLLGGLAGQAASSQP